MRLRPAVVALSAIGCWALGAGVVPAQAANPEIKHVFIVVLENENSSHSFAADSPAPYLAHDLRAKGAYVPNYYATGHLSLDNYISMVSGQPPNATTQADCPIFLDFLQLLPADSLGVLTGQGCVYPASVQTVANQLQDRGLTWKGYMEDMRTPCRHPRIGASDDTQDAEVGDQYAGRHNPFIYFHSIIDSPACAQNDVDYSHLASDLKSAATTPDYAFITPNLCNDGHDEPCVDGRPGGLVSANEWLKTNIPAILGSPAYRDHGLLIVTFDEAEDSDAAACCGELTGPNTIAPGITGPGGGKVGAVLLSPCISPGTTDDTPYNHYSLLKSTENFFGLPHLGYARPAGVSSFGDKVFTRPACPVRAKKCAKKKAKKKHKHRARAHGKKKHKKHKKKSCKKNKKRRKKN